MTENKKGLAVQLSLSKCQTCKVLDIQPVQCSNECSHALPSYPIDSKKFVTFLYANNELLLLLSHFSRVQLCATP